MNGKIISIVAIAVAVLSGSIAAVVVNVNRTEQARLIREAAASKEAAADANRKAEAKKADAEASKRSAEEIKRETAADELAKSKEARATAEADERAAEEKRKAKEAERATAEAQAEAARAARDEARAKEKAALAAKEQARIEAEAAALKAQAAADALATEKLKSEKVIAESKLIEQRQIDFSEWQRNLLELQRDLDEREAALKPEKTIADLSWAGGMEDTVIDEKGNVKKQVREPYDPEKDKSLPKTSRYLAKYERLVKEAHEAEAKRVKEGIIAAMEKLYVQAIKDDDVIHAEYLRASIKTLYPDWEFKGEKEK